MNKNRIVLAAIGGVVIVAVLAMSAVAYFAYADKVLATEGDDEEGAAGLETVVAEAQSLSRKPVYPSAESVTAIGSNAQLVAEWRSEAVKLASRGDRMYEATTPAAFKTFIVGDAKRLAGLPGFVSGKIVKPDFAFGPFKDYIAEGKMPTEAQLPELQRKWDDVTTVVETLAQAGIAELVNIEFKVKEAAKEESEKPQKRGARKPAGKSAAKRSAGSDKTVEPSAHTYVFTFTTRPSGFVKVINALGTSERFVVVDSFSFQRGRDAIAEALGGEEKNAEAQQSRGRRGRRGRREAEPAAPEAGATKNGIVTDPALDEPMTVVMTATVYDFRSLEKTEEVSK